jgi:hypothetical protein
MQRRATLTTTCLPACVCLRACVCLSPQAVAKIDFQRVPESESIVPCGTLLNKVGATFVVIGNVNDPGKALDEGTIVCLENRSVLGRVEEVRVASSSAASRNADGTALVHLVNLRDDPLRSCPCATRQVFGPVAQPHYMVRFGCVINDDAYDPTAGAAPAEGASANSSAGGGGFSDGGSGGGGRSGSNATTPGDATRTTAAAGPVGGGVGEGCTRGAAATKAKTSASSRRKAADGGAVTVVLDSRVSAEAPPGSVGTLTLAKRNADYKQLLQNLVAPLGTPLFAVVGTIRYVVEVRLESARVDPIAAGSSGWLALCRVGLSVYQPRIAATLPGS